MLLRRPIPPQSPLMTKRTNPKPAGKKEGKGILQKVAPFLFGRRKRVHVNAADIAARKRAAHVTYEDDIAGKSKKTSRLRLRTTPSQEKTRNAKKTENVSIADEEIPQDASPSARTVQAPVATISAVKKTADAPVSKSSFTIAEEKAAEDAPTPSASGGLRGAGKAVEAQLLAEHDSFLAKAGKKLEEENAKKKKGSWFVLRDRFTSMFTRGPKEAAEQTPQEELTEKDIAKDTFLQHVQQKRTSAVVGTAIDEEEAPTASSLEEFASGGKDEEELVPRATSSKQRGANLLSAVDLQKETREAKEAAKRLEKEVKEIKEEMKAGKGVQGQKKEAPPPPPETRAPKKHVVHVTKTRLQKFTAALGYIGMGKERLRFIENMATMLNAGLPLIDSLKTMQLETRTKGMKKLMQRILDSVENGNALWRAMDEQSFFSLHAIALVRIGEEAGNLSENMVYLAEQEEKDHALKSKVKMAMIYPSIVLTLMFIIVMGLGLFVLPNLIGVLFSLNVKLPLVTRLVILFTQLISQYSAIVVPGSLAGGILLVILGKFTPLRSVFQWIMFRIPGIGRLAREATIARYGVILGGLLRAGVPVIEAMQSLVEVTPIVSYRRLYQKMLDHVAIGDSFSKSFAAIKGSQKLLPASVQQLIITGEKSGALADIMLKIADIYDKKASETAQKLPVILEPILLLFIGGLVGTIAFAIIVPIYSIVGSVGR